MADIRETRPTELVPGVGGFIEFTWRDTTVPVVSRVEIREWAIEHKYINARLAMTGGLGSIQYRRVADTFDFAVIAHMDLRTTRAQTPAKGPSAQPFFDGRMEGSPSRDFLIKMHFQCGDSTVWDFPNEEPLPLKYEMYGPLAKLRSGIYQTCDEVILDKVRLIDSSRAEVEDGVLRYLIDGHGCQPLQRWVGQQWCGGGAFGISQQIQGQVPVVPEVVVP